MILEDGFGNKVRLTDERLAHILDHPEMQGMEKEIERVLREPQRVRRRARTELCGCFMGSTPRHWWVANGCALWLSTSRTILL
jgi:hypothetical protein